MKRFFSIQLISAVLAAAILTVSAGNLFQVHAQVPIVQATLVRTIDTSQWSPASPDPSGLAYWPGRNSLLVSDAEVEEMPPYYTGKNIFESSPDGNLIGTAVTTAYSKEPTGVAVNAAGGQVFFSDDNKKRIFIIQIGADGILGTGDDKRTYIKTADFGSTDPEGLAYGQGKLFIADGGGKEVYIVDPGANGKFDGVVAPGDDIVTHFDTSGMAQTDPEGIEYNPDDNTLFIVSNKTAADIAETTLDGTLLRTIEISFINAKAKAGLAYGPSSADPDQKSIYMAARGIDNNDDPLENDGKIYEISIQSAPTATPTWTPTPTTPDPTATPTQEPVITATPTPTESAPTPTTTVVPTPTVVSLNPIADATVKAATPDTNYGAVTPHEVDGSPVKIVYMKFDLNFLAGKSVTSAKLRLRVTNGSDSTQIVKHVEDTNWSEAAVTYNTRPSLSSEIAQITGGVSGVWKEIDITSAVAGKTGQLMSIGIDSTGSDGLDFSSKEHSSNKPQLVVEYN